ncbi:MAG: hypothetical protein ACJ72G_10990 [Friedmanniella sp.]|jgi:hypothetical protein
MTEDKRITVEEDGQLLAQATVSPPDENNQARAQVHVAAGHLPIDTRRKLADAVCDAVTEDNAERLTATVPVGDAELVERMRDHLSDVELRAAGATSIIKGEIRPS